MRARRLMSIGLRAVLSAALGLTPVVLAGPASAEEDVSVLSSPGERPPPPWTVDDAYVTDQDVPLDTGRTGRSILDNDSQFESVTVVLMSDPAHGTVEMVSEDHLVYTAAPGFHGTDSFTYETHDYYDQKSYTAATVTVTVRPADRALVTAPDVYETPAGAELSVAAPGYLGNDVSPDGLPLTQAAVTLVVPAAAGSAVHSADGSFVYTPPPGFQGSTSFTYVATDGVVHARPQTVTVRVVGATPTAVDDAYVLDEDTTLVAGSVLTNDVAPDGSVLSSTMVTEPAHGTAALAPGGTFTYTPETDFDGTDSFTYEASDGTSASAPVTVTLTVTPVEDFPPVAVDDAYTTEQDMDLDNRVLGLSVLDNDVTDVAATAVLVTGSGHGVTFMHPDGMFQYYPDAGFQGLDSFTYLTRTGSDSTVATVTLTVRPADRALVGTPDSYETPIGVELTVVAPGVLANDASPDGLPLSATIAEQPDNGSVVLDADGAFRYVPSAGFQGVDWFVYALTDGVVQKRVQISVRMVGPSPVAKDDFHEPLEDFTYVANWGILHNDVSSDGRPLTAVKVSDPAHGSVTVAPDGIFTYVPDKDFNGTDSFTYTASDGTTSSAPATVTLTVRADDEPPTFAVPVRNLTTVQGTPLSGGLTVINTDNLTLEYRGFINRHPSGGSVSMDEVTGEWTFTPLPDFVGATYVEASACDTYLGRCAYQGLRITVSAAPVPPPPPVAPVATDQTVWTTWGRAVEGAFVVSDADSPTLTVTVTDGPRRGTVAVDQAARTFVYRPAWWSTGDDAFGVRLCDPDGLCDSARVTVDLRRSWWMPSPVMVRPSWLTTMAASDR